MGEERKEQLGKRRVGVFDIDDLYRTFAVAMIFRTDLYL